MLVLLLLFLLLVLHCYYYYNRGPTLDERIKPDIVGPGEGVWSAKARLKTSPQNAKSCDIVHAMGTSSSTPIVAGAAVLIRQYFKEGFYPRGVKNDPAGIAFEPMGALIKAILVNSGRPLSMTSSRGRVSPE